MALITNSRENVRPRVWICLCRCSESADGLTADREVWKARVQGAWRDRRQVVMGRVAIFLHGEGDKGVVERD